MIALFNRSKKFWIILPAFILLYTLTFGLKLNQTKGVEDISVIKPSSNMVLSGSWGKADGQFGKTEENFITGPMSFKVYNDKIFFLDQENKRVQTFNLSGDFLESFSIRKTTYVDIKADSNNVYLLDAFGGYTVDVYSTEGDLKQTLPIDKKLQPVTGFQVIEGVVMVESNHDTSKVIGDINGAKVSKVRSGKVIDGREGPGGKPVEAEFGQEAEVVKAGRLYDYDSPDLLAILDLIIEGKDTYLLTAHGKQSEGSLTQTYFSLTKVTDPGWQIILPDKYATDHFRKADVSEGKIYQMQTTDEGVKLIQWKP